jgi:hypothetical protein
MLRFCLVKIVVPIAHRFLPFIAMYPSFSLRLSHALMCIFCLAGCFVFSVNAQSLTNLPMKSLTVGNKWIYSNSGYELNLNSATNDWFRTLTVETVIGDTMIQNRTYGIVHNSFRNSKRYERSNDTAIFVWYGKDVVAHSWNVASGQAIYWNEWTNYPSKVLPSYFYHRGYYSTTAVVRTESVLAISQNSYFAPPGNGSSFQADFQRPIGLTRVANSGDYFTFRNNFSYSSSLRFSVIDGNVRSDSAFLAASPLSISLRSDIAKVFPGDTVSIAVVIRHSRLWQNYYSALGITPVLVFSYKVSTLEPIGSTPQGLIANGICTFPLQFQIPLPWDSVVIRTQFRALVGGDTIATLTACIDSLRYSWISLPPATSATVQIATNRAGGALRFFSPRAQMLVAEIILNPVSDILDIYLTADQPATVEGVVLNALGIPIFTIKPRTIDTGQQTLTFPVEHLPSGCYYLTLRSYNETIQRQFVIIH